MIKSHVGPRVTSISKIKLEECLNLLGLDLSYAEIDYLIVQCILES